MAESTSPLSVVEETPAYWRVVFDYPPFNVLDGTMFQSLQDLLARMDASQTLRVVVFESAIPDFYLAHFDLTGKMGNVMSGVGPTSLPVLLDTFVRLTKSRSSVSRESADARAAQAASLSSRATCALHRARTRDLANPKSQWASIRAAEGPNVSRTWSAAVAPSKSSLAAMISTVTQPSATGTSIVLSRMRNWTVLSMRSHAESHLSTDPPSPRQ